MFRFFAIMTLGVTVLCFAAARQNDSTAAPTEFRFSPGIRSAVVEASTVLFLAGSYGPTLDLDFLEIPSETITHLGFRFSYQSLSYGFLKLRNESGQPIGNITGAFLRGSHPTPKSRLDLYAGVVSMKSSRFDEGLQFLFGADIRLRILKPWSSFFVRILGNTRGMIVFLGLTLGYDT